MNFDRVFTNMFLRDQRIFMKKIFDEKKFFFSEFSRKFARIFFSLLILIIMLKTCSKVDFTSQNKRKRKVYGNLRQNYENKQKNSESETGCKILELEPERVRNWLFYTCLRINDVYSTQAFIRACSFHGRRTHKVYLF